MTPYIRWPTVLLMGLGLLVAGAGSLGAEESKPHEEATKATQPQEPERHVNAQPKEMVGRIMAVERDRGVLTIAQDIPLSPDAITELVINDQTLVTRDTRRLGIEDLRPGEEYVRIRYIVADARPVALAIVFEPLPQLQRLSGLTQAIDLVNGDLVVRPHGLISGSPKHFRVNEATVITREGLRSYLTHLLIGDEVTVDYTTDEETLTAHFITVKSSQSGKGWFSSFGGERDSPSLKSQRSWAPVPKTQ